MSDFQRYQSKPSNRPSSAHGESSKEMRQARTIILVPGIRKLQETGLGVALLTCFIAPRYPMCGHSGQRRAQAVSADVQM